MLIYFSVENYRSINKTVSLNLKANTRLRRMKNHCRRANNVNFDILKSALVYGANASGKSNLIRAMDFAKEIILGNKNITTKHQFKFASNNNKTTSFYFEFLFAKNVYSYGFSFDEKSVIDEELRFLSGDKERDNTLIFSRTRASCKDDTEEFYEIDSSFFTAEFLISNTNEEKTTREQEEREIDNFKVLLEFAPKDSLFLTDFITRGMDERFDFIGEIMHHPYYYFRACLIIIFPETRYGSLHKDLASNEEEGFENANYIRYLKEYDTSIEGLELKEISISTFPRELLEEVERRFEYEDDDNIEIIFNDIDYIFHKFDSNVTKAYKIYTKHTDSSGKIKYCELNEESDGTRRLLDLIPILPRNSEKRDDLFNKVGGVTYVIDEFDRSLHPLLSKAFIKDFLDGKGGQDLNQLIVSTHEAELLDKELLRRDEIYFIQKEKDNSSQLYSLDEYNERFDKDIQRAYLSGRYGAVPNILNNN